MLRHSFGLSAEADTIERAVADVLAAGIRTQDIVQGNDHAVVSTSEMGDAVSGAAETFAARPAPHSALSNLAVGLDFGEARTELRPGCK